MPLAFSPEPVFCRFRVLAFSPEFMISEGCFESSFEEWAGESELRLVLVLTNDFVWASAGFFGSGRGARCLGSAGESSWIEGGTCGCGARELIRGWRLARGGVVIQFVLCMEADGA